MQYTLDDNEIVASPEGIQGSLDELSRKSNQFEADVQRMEEVSGVTSSINLSTQARQQLIEVQKNLNIIQQKLDEVRKAKADRQHQQAAELLREANTRMRYSEALYSMALADENILTSQ